MDSQESIIELDNNSLVVDMNFTNMPGGLPISTGNILQQIEQWEHRLSQLNINPPPVLFHNHAPERSQSSLSFVNEINSDYSMTNKLGVQHGIVQTMRKLSRTEDTIKLSHTLKKRRSYSADSRFIERMSVPNEAYYQKLIVDLRTTPSTTRSSRETIRFLSVPAPQPDIQIQVNGKGVEI